MKRFMVYVASKSLDRSATYYGSNGRLNLAYFRKCLAKTRREALNKCLPEIRKLKVVDPTILYVSIYVGTNGMAERLMPYQMIVETGEIR